MTLPFFRRNPSDDLYNRGYQAILRPGQRIWSPHYADSKDPHIWEKAMQDVVVSGAIERRLISVAGKTWTLEPGGATEKDLLLAEVMLDIVKSTKRFTEARRNLAKAAFTGAAFADITGRFEWRTFHDGKQRRWWVPGRLKDIDRRMFTLKAEDRDDGNIVGEWHRRKRFPDKSWRWQKVERPDLLVTHIYQDEHSQLGYGRGIMDSIYFATYIRAAVQKKGLQGLDKWALGMVIASLDALADGGIDDDNVTRAQNAAATIRKMMEDHVLVVDDRDKVDVKEGGMQGHQMVTEWLDRIEKDLIVRIEGNYLPSGGDGQGGAYSLGVDQADEREGWRQYDRESLNESLRHFLRFLREMNRATLDEIEPGLSRAELPQFSITTEKREDPKEFIEVVKGAQEAGLTLVKSNTYERLNLPEPSADAIEQGDVIEPGSSLFAMQGLNGAPPFMGGGPLGGDGGGTDPNEDEAGQQPHVPAQPKDGQQVKSLVEITTQVTTGRLAPEAAVEVLLFAFPDMDPDRAKKIVDASVKFEPKEPEPTPGGGGEKPEKKPAEAAA